MKKLIHFFAVGLMFMGLTACSPTLHSMGAAVQPAPINHRATSDSAVTEAEVAVSGFWAHNWDADNIKDMNAGGGNVSTTYRLGKVFFVNAAVGGFGGSLKFSCDEDADCNDIVTFTNREKEKTYSINGSDDYNDWLRTSEGQKFYSFMNFQERILVGIDANLGKYVILGVAGGIQAYQGGSDYDEIREELGDLGYIDNSDAKNGIAPTSAWWIGMRFGKNGKFGNFTIEFDDVYKGTIGDWVGARKYTYAHPTGFFLGVTEGDLISLGVFAGKQFVF